MGYDEGLVARVRVEIARHGAADEVRMFGGLAFLLAGNMAVCASHDGGLLVRTDGSDPSLLDGEHVDPMAMGSGVSRTWLRVAPAGLSADEQLRVWVDRGAAVATALPPKAPRRRGSSRGSGGPVDVHPDTAASPALSPPADRDDVAGRG